ncbi:hypothetical protein JT359_04955 [Candidatus Poribacteria bacterium]|nr:hypothetical protein [Candidatus Poribacteria bacterium]
MRRNNVGLVRKLIQVIFSLILIYQANIVTAEINIGGYYKNYFTAFDTLQSDSLTGIVSNRLRLNLSLIPSDTYSFNFSYDFAPRIQDPTLFNDSAFTLAIPSQKYRVTDLTSRIYPNDNKQASNIGIYHNLDRASLYYSTDFADISIGRDAIAWGSARVINPTDVVAPFSFDQLDTEDRVGVDAVRLRIPIGVLGEVDTGYVIGENFDYDKSALFLRTQLNAIETDFSITLIHFQRNLLTGIDITRGIGGAGFWLEVAYVATQQFLNGNSGSENYLRSSIGLDYSFDGTVFTFIEYHYNGAGTKNPDDYIENVNQPAYTDGGVYLFGIHYLAPGISYQVTPLINIGSQILFNLSDKSASFIPQISYNVAEDIHLSIGGLLSIGKPPINNDLLPFGSEFGAYPNLFFSSFQLFY